MRKKYLAIVLLSAASSLYAEDSSVVVKEEVVGNVKVTAEGRNIDEASQRRIEWKSRLKKGKSERKKNRRSEEKEEEDDDSSSVSVKFKWPARD